MRITIIIAIVCLLVGYIIGIFLPCNILPKINEDPISRGDFFYYTVTALGVVATFLTVLVALFKEDFIRLFKKVKLKYSFLSENKLQEDIEDVDGTKKAKKYYSTVIIENIGNIHAENCELYIDRIEYSAGGNTNILLSESKPVKWSGEREHIYIPSKASTVLHLFELFPPQNSSTPEEKEKNNHAGIKLLGYQKLEIEETGNVGWKCYYSIHSSSMTRTKRFETKIIWNGKWEHRLSEMSKILTFELEDHE